MGTTAMNADMFRRRFVEKKRIREFASIKGL